MKEIIKKYNDKFNAFPLWRKLLAIAFIVLILYSFYLLATRERIDKIKYQSGCEEVYINGKLNSSYCLQDREQMKKTRTGNVIWSPQLPTENLTQISVPLQ